MKKRKGFTLIELLVVIAIIGILAAIVVVSTRAAITKGKDAQIQAAINQVRSVAEMIMNDEAKYDSLCDTATNQLNTRHATYGTQLTNITNQVTSANGGTPPTCYATTDKYCVVGKLASKSGTSDKYFCVDNTGLVTTTIGTITCDGTNYDCL